MNDTTRPDSPEPVSRRAFVHGTLGAGAGVAAVWSLPSLRTVRPLQAAGSPPPQATTTTTVDTPVTAVGATTTSSTSSTSSTTTTPIRTQGDPAAATTTTDPGAVTTGPAGSGSGSLPLTGTEATELAALGTAAVLGGRALMAARSRNAVPAEGKYQPNEPSGDDS